MIWECTVCTNHFEGPAPPEFCRSCGSPRQYFTAYHYYGLRTPSTSPRVEKSPVARPAYTETSIEAAKCFRFHDIMHFHCDPDHFYRNFLESEHSFLKRCRFAGKGYHSGFYFAMTKEAAVAEKLHYSNFTGSGFAGNELSLTPQDVLTQLRNHGENCIFMEVTLSMRKIADLTDPIVLEYFLREGPARANFQPPGVPHALAKIIVPSSAGGSKHTDGIGYHAASNGWSAVKFPSVRALNTEWNIENFSRSDLLTKSAQDHPKSTERSVEATLRDQAVIVVFSGSLLSRSVSHYAWTDTCGTRATSRNPYFQVDSKTLEEIRVNFAKENKLTRQEAAAWGYLSDEEIQEKYIASEVFWVSEKESI